jgi:hypothetical protein
MVWQTHSMGARNDKADRHRRHEFKSVAMGRRIPKRTAYFVSLKHEWFNVGTIPAVGINTFIVWQGLCRFVWRGRDNHDPEVEALCAQNLLVTRIGQARLAEVLGLSRWTVNKAIKHAKALGWVVIEPSKGRVPIYLLGNWWKLDGKRQEVYLANTAVALWGDGIRAETLDFKALMAQPVETRTSVIRDLLWDGDKLRENDDAEAIVRFVNQRSNPAPR